ncbi:MULTISPECIES: hypothetical protein [unclassified Pseudomonas]|uniref:hypothetical protein n=1 Tax=unclassified Pseudomonas TaxID=196821 RepID=UPI002AC8FFB9|nr:MULTISPECIES: hypothetical protein [unclassified Pseudomonas]MEB0040933.1 hypothetical protein [Pseudomonas sp. MH10]MEB0078911.1 hypothetical protein [Pseudomonas sp. MH10out]MEB0090007.1 hypothetical protein [Pseudomonas sp. CCI4.2]MEB0102025.1 hypothetical protein [Pseudomonas sp. CCI3.2]MEB0120981.1 hypothetical protein [Pseudomonas sp. CCI1.2]
MLKDKEWQHSLPDFLTGAQTLLTKSDECLSHLELFTNDKDAIECLLGTLLTLAHKADALGLDGITDFSLRINRLLSLAYPHISLQGDTLRALKNCFTLLAWQLELIDADTGLLLLDDSEQVELLYAFATIAGLEHELASLMPSATWSTPLALRLNVIAHRH